ncbi:MAG TPA: 2-amino-4-hydroxy-6-hydroxymethyldihydropteridine diphosphokinase [Thermoanaerobaculia bacterium]
MVIALGSNLGDRLYNLRRALHEIGTTIRIVRLSGVHETAAVDAPPGSPPFLNMALAGYTMLEPRALLDEMLSIERRLGRVRREKNGPRVIDIDLIVYGARRIWTDGMIVPHPRAAGRAFVIDPVGECAPAVRDFLLRRLRESRPRT